MISLILRTLLLLSGSCDLFSRAFKDTGQGGGRDATLGWSDYAVLLGAIAVTTKSSSLHSYNTRAGLGRLFGCGLLLTFVVVLGYALSFVI